MLITFHAVTFGYAGVPILEDVGFTLNEGERVGFLGVNGAGKTTFIKLMLGELVPDRGEILRKKGAKIGYLEQVGGFESEKTVYEAMQEVFEEDGRILGELADTQKRMAHADEREFARLSARAEYLMKQVTARDSYHVDVKIRTVLCGMGFEKFYDRKIDGMSGGEKTKLKLCRLLLEEPDLLVLDEPTNHLDMKTLFWLEEYLSSYKGALFVVSHDRYFLDALTTRTLDLEAKRVGSYKGSYSKYRILKEEERKLKQREYEKTVEELAKLKDYVDRNLVRATTAKSAQSRVKQIEKIAPPEPPVPPPQPPVFRFEYDETPYERVLDTEPFDLFAGEKKLLTGAQFTLMRTDKCALVGDNGTGKSTLVKFLISSSPKIRRGKYAKIGYYDQEMSDLDGEERVLDAFWGKYRLLSQTDARALLARSGIQKEDIDKKVKELSGGQRAKLSVALLQAKRANVLVLDEPTNHLDLESREALEEALKAFGGTLLFVSHDRRFIESVATRIVKIENGTLSSFQGGYREFLEREKSASEEKQKEKEPAKNTGGAYRSKEDRAKEAQRRNRISQIERRLEEIEAEEEKLNGDLAACASDYKRVTEITDTLAALRAESDGLYAEYETLI